MDYGCSTGFYVDAIGTVVTAAHVVEGADVIAVGDHQDSEREYGFSHVEVAGKLALLKPLDGGWASSVQLRRRGRRIATRSI